MKKTRTYIFDALVNLIAQSVLFFIGMFVWVNPVYEVIWALAARRICGVPGIHGARR